MSNALQTLGERMFHWKWWIGGFWLIVLAVLGFLAIQFMQPVSSTISIPGTQAQQALDRFNELFPNAGSKTGTVVVAAPEGKTLVDYRDTITATTEKIGKVEHVTASISPFDNPQAISKDGTIGFITAQLQDNEGVVDEAAIAQIRDIMSEQRQDGLTIEAGGDLVSQELGQILGVGEIAGVVIALVVLVVTLGSLIAAGMPLVTALIAVGVSMGGLFALSGVIELTSTAPVLAVMLGLAVGIDYSLFIINRYRTFVKEGYDLEEAAGRAIATAGNAVLFAAATVVIALAALSIVQIPFMTTMGLAAAATVAIAALIAVTLMPALFGIVRLRIFSKKTRRQIIALQSSHKIKKQHVKHTTFGYTIAEKILKFRFPVLFVALAVIAVLALPMTQLKLGLPTDEYAATGTSERTAYELLEKGFGAGYGGQLLIVAEGLPVVSEEAKMAAKEQLLAAAAAQAGVNQLPSPMKEAALAQLTERLQPQLERFSQTIELQKVAERLKAVDGVANAQAALATTDGSKGAIQVTPTTGPSDEATRDLVASLRTDETKREVLQQDSASLAVTGTTAVQIDIDNKLTQALPLYLGVVVGLSFILLMVAFRSVLIPLKATLGFLLSVAAMFGALVAIFQFGWFGITEAPGPIITFIPIIAIGILFGLAMDYEFFLVSGMREAYHHTKDARKSIIRGYALGSRVVIAAGLIMVSVFAGFIFSSDVAIQSIGFALAIGVLVDAFIVRMVVTPIIMSYLGKRAWWLPRWLERILPQVSIEGSVKH